MSHYLFTSESVSRGHPDKLADQISDAILDACLEQDPSSRIACETMLAHGLVVLAGEITTNASVDYEAIARRTIAEVGYTKSSFGMDAETCGVITCIHKQSADIAMGVEEGRGLHLEQGAGDQGLVFGFACNETPQYMPLPITYAQNIIDTLWTKRANQELCFLGPDAKSQVTVEYDENHQPCRVDTVVLSTQHTEQITHQELQEAMIHMIQEVIPLHLLDEKTTYHINPTGRFVKGGPAADCGLTGRKPIVDTYGGRGRHGGGAFSGKDPSKIDRSAAYAARNIAKTIVAAGLSQECEVQLAYAIGVAEPVSIKVDCQGTSAIAEEDLAKAIQQVFTLTPQGIQETFGLKRPIYRFTAFGGHFGREEFPWEKVTKTEEILSAVQQLCP